MEARKKNHLSFKDKLMGRMQPYDQVDMED